MTSKNNRRHVTKTPERLVAEWNRDYPKGTAVVWFYNDDHAQGRETVTTLPARVHKGEAVVRVSGYSGWPLLNTVLPVKCIRCQRLALSDKWIKFRDKHEAEALRTGLGIRLSLTLGRDDCNCAIGVTRLRREMMKGPGIPAEVFDAMPSARDLAKADKPRVKVRMKVGSASLSVEESRPAKKGGPAGE